MNSWKSSKDDNFSVVSDYFAGMFHSEQPSIDQLAPVLDSVQPRLSYRSGRFLDSRFLPEEIHRAIFDMAPSKVLGPDGLPALFYQKFWHLVGPQVTTVCLSVLNVDASLD
ncbi:hypothetical protein Ddye_029413 [Dipteronia dyeriana]|uniref:Reverse transcriptase n=1 Tax=Dipteronia dyeriana TaxID=168575 RepID=A0AAD9WKM4_9ROSI|nr:hypothetical protein Ddye_029413 [Dipteronia dyeriana]